MHGKKLRKHVFQNPFTSLHRVLIWAPSGLTGVNGFHLCCLQTLTLNEDLIHRTTERYIRIWPVSCSGTSIVFILYTCVQNTSIRPSPSPSGLWVTRTLPPPNTHTHSHQTGENCIGTRYHLTCLCKHNSCSSTLE